MTRPPSLVAFADAAIPAGWRIEWRDATRPVSLPPEITERYGPLPPSYVAFLSNLARATSADDAVWFLCERELGQRDSGAFSWNELERMAHESARDDDERQRVVSFWNRHFPVMMAPNGDYDYLALALDATDGIVHGSAPEWEVVTRVADSFEDWLEMLSRALTDGKGVSTSRALQVMARHAP